MSSSSPTSSNLSTATHILLEFIDDVEAAGVEDVKQEWSDIHVTYQRAKTLIRRLKLDCKYVCGNCGLHAGGTSIKVWLPNIPDLGQRLTPGDPVPDAECPSCGALMYKEKPKTFKPNPKRKKTT